MKSHSFDPPKLGTPPMLEALMIVVELGIVCYGLGLLQFFQHDLE